MLTDDTDNAVCMHIGVARYVILVIRRTTFRFYHFMCITEEYSTDITNTRNYKIQDCIRTSWDLAVPSSV